MRKVKVSDIKIHEFKNGTFQIWSGNLVLAPHSLNWEAEYQKHHDFMYIESMKKARQLVKQVKEKQGLFELLKVHDA